MVIGDSFSLYKQGMRVAIEDFYNFEKLTIENLMEKLEKTKKKAINENYEDVRIEFDMEECDEYGHQRAFMVIMGTRPETDEEWLRRLESNRQHSKNTIDNATKIMSKVDFYNDQIAKIDEALSKSSLKCKQCGSVCSSLFFDKKLCIECARKHTKC